MFRPRGAFTLVELLVVIGIVAVLMAFLVPSLQNAREVAWLVKCSSGVRQSGLAHQIYMGDWNQSMIATGYVNQGEGWYGRLVNNGYAQQTNFTRSGGCPYAPAKYQLGDNSDSLNAHGLPNKHSAYGMNSAMTGYIDLNTKAWYVFDWDPGTLGYTAKGITSARQYRYKRYAKWASDIMLMHCSTAPNSASTFVYGVNVRYTLGIATGSWVVDPDLTTYARHKGKNLPMLFSDQHAEQITGDFWMNDRSREVRWKSMANYNKPEYTNSGVYLNPDL